MEGEIGRSFTKAASWLAKFQKKDGSWPRDRHLFSEPESYLAELMITSQCARTLLLMNDSNYFPQMQRALTFCANYPLERGDPTPWYVWKLEAVGLSNTESNKRQASMLSRALIKRQDEHGFWPAFPTTQNTTNCMAVDSLIGKNQTALNRVADWFRKSRAKDNKGWGHDAKAKKSEIPSTAYITTALISCGEKFNSDIMKKTYDYIRKTQRSDGIWVSLRVKTPSVYATARATIAMMLLSKNPFAPEIEKSIKSLLKTQSNTGGWAFVSGKSPQFYVTYHVVLALSFWKHLKEQWDRPEIIQLRKQTGSQATAIWLFKNFPEYLKDRYDNMLLRSMLNTKALGSTKDAIRRRKDILRVLSDGGPGETAEVIDRLKMIPRYENLSKKSHITQIKADLDYLADIGIISLNKYQYALIRDFLKN